MHINWFRAICILIVTISSTALGANWTESFNGDLADDGQSPTPLVFDLGVNTVSGTMGTPFLGQLDPDIFTITLGPGQQLTSIVVQSITPGQNSFFAIAAGPTISMTDGTSHLSNILIGEPGEYFDNLAFPEFGGEGIGQPLGAGTYTIWFQETQLQRDYTMAYTVVPEPASVSAGLLALSVAVGRRCGRRA